VGQKQQGTHHNNQSIRNTKNKIVMAVNDFIGKKWSDRTLGGKILYGATVAGATAATLPMGGWGGAAVMGANEVGKQWKGDKGRLEEIEAQAAELENSEFNTAKLTAENQDYYKNAAAAYAKASREQAMGFSPEQKAEARQTFAEGSNLAMQNAQNAGGGTMQNYINAAMNTNANKFATSMASQDADLKMRNKQQNDQLAMNYLNQLGNASGLSQDVFTQNFNKNIMAEQAIGQAERDWYTQRDTNRRDLINAGTSLAGQAIAAGASGG
jgi:hypothetical protein